MKHKKRLSLFVVSVMILSMLTGCGSYNSVTKNITSSAGGIIASDSVMENGFSFNSAPNKAPSYIESEINAETPEAPSQSTEISKGENTEQYLEKKIVYTANIDAQTKNMVQAQKDLNEMIESVGGYIESEQSYKNGGFDYGYTHTTLEIKIRIPSAKYNEFLNGLEGENIYINNINKNSNDYSLVYYDKESRINSLKIQEERLYELLADANSIEIMLQIENQLSNIRYEIESLTREMKFIDSNVDYSTVNLSIEEVVKYNVSQQEPTSFFEELINTIKDSAENFGEWCKDALFALIYLFPYFVILCIVIAIVLRIIKKKKEKKMCKNQDLVNKSQHNTNTQKPTELDNKNNK